MKTYHFKSLFFLLAFSLPFWLMAATPADRQTREVGTFKALKASSGVDVYLEPGSRENVVVEGNHQDMEEIITEVKDGTLHIYRKSKFGFHFTFHSDCKIYVTAVNLESVDVSSGSEVKSNGRFKGQTCKVNSSSGSELSLDLEYDKLTAGSSSGSEITLKGKTRTLSVSVSSGSEIKACDLTAEVVQADASSGAEACVNVTTELHANASSGGDIRYEGHPGVVDVHKSSGGGVSGH
jgi:hypothetical protein